MSLLVVTRADERIREITNLTHPIIKRFANQWGADFLVLSSKDNCEECIDWRGKIHYRIMKLYDLLEEYDRIANIDSDIIINKNCPDLFGIVPYDKIGVVFEDKGKRRANRHKRIHKIQTTWGEIGWRKDYINIGVALFSKPHKKIFKKIEGRYWEDWGYPDVHLGYQIHRMGIEIFKLDWRFNHMCMFSEQWNNNASRFDSYILHYAGHARFSDKGNRSKEQMIKDDIERIYG